MNQRNWIWRPILALCVMIVALEPGLAKRSPSYGRSAFVRSWPAYMSGWTEPRYFPAYRFGWWKPAYYRYPYSWAEIQATRSMVRMP
jgi:hypothetical protein